MDFGRTFHPTPEEKAEDERRLRELHEKLSKEKGCVTCRNCKQIYRYPGFVTAEECVCTAGLICDTVLHSVKNCKKYEELGLEEERPRDHALNEDGIAYVVSGN